MRPHPHRSPQRSTYRRLQQRAPGIAASNGEASDDDPEQSAVLKPIIESPQAEIQPRARTSRNPWRRWSARRIALVIVPSGLALIILAFMVPVLIEARRAYDQIFVTPAPRLDVVLNEQGTPVIVSSSAVAETPTAEPVATEPGVQETPVQSASDVTPEAATPATDPREEALAGLPDWDQKERVNILLLGLDLRDNGDVSRSDTIIIVSVDPATKQVGMLSVPRDLLVTIPNYGADKINAAYPYGQMSGLTGPALVRATIEYNFGLPIHYFIAVETEGFVEIVDTLGGVTVDVAAPIKDDEYPAEEFNYTRAYFPSGLQHLDGTRALQYARTRHDDNDFARGNRQQELLQALREQNLNLDLITNARELLSELGDSVRTDLSPSQVLALGKLSTEIESDDITTFNLVNATTAQWLPGQPYYLIPDWAAIQEILDEMVAPEP